MRHPAPPSSYKYVIKFFENYLDFIIIVEEGVTFTNKFRKIIDVDILNSDCWIYDMCDVYLYKTNFFKKYIKPWLNYCKGIDTKTLRELSK